MACGSCGGGPRKGTVTSRGTVLGFEVVYDDGTKHPTLFDDHIDAKKHTLVYGGTAQQVMQA